MGFSSDPNVATSMSMLWTDKSENFSRCLAYNIFNELISTHDGVKYFDVLYPTGVTVTQQLTSKLLVVEAREEINHLAAANPAENWRIAFEITGYTVPTTGGGTEFIGTTLKAYVGTKTTIYPDASLTNTWYYKTGTVEVLLVQGGNTPTSKRISESDEYQYRISIAGGTPASPLKKRGLVIACWETYKIEDDMSYFGFFCIQRPVGPKGQPGGVNEDGTLVANTSYTNPVICVHNTQTINGVPNISSNFYYSIVREKFIEVPTKGTEITSDAAATITLNFVPVTLNTGEKFLYNPDLEFAGNGSVAYIKLGSNYDGSNPPPRITADDKVGKTIYSAFTNNPEDNAKKLYDVMKNKQDIAFFRNNFEIEAPQRVPYYDASGTTPGFKDAWQIRMICLNPGAGGNDFTVKLSNAGSALKVAGRSTGTTGVTGFSGGGTTAAKAYATIRFNSLPTVDQNTSKCDKIYINGIPFTFVDPNVTPSSQQVRIGTGANAIKDTIDNLIKGILRYRHPYTLTANYYYSNTPYITGMTGWNTGSDYLVIEFNDPGIQGNNFTLNIDYGVSSTTTGGTTTLTQTMQIQPYTDGNPYNSLVGGTGFFQYDANSVLSTEISDPLSRHGSMIYPFPKTWEAPVTTDHDEYVLEFPFGFCTDKLAFTEEMDMIAVSKGMAYQARQEVPIRVYGEASDRIYTALAINKKKFPDKPVRFFMLTKGGNTKE